MGAECQGHQGQGSFQGQQPFPRALAVRGAHGSLQNSPLHVLHTPLVGQLLHRLLVGNAGKALLLKPVGPAKGQELLGRSSSHHSKFSTNLLCLSFHMDLWLPRADGSEVPHLPLSHPSRHSSHSWEFPKAKLHCYRYSNRIKYLSTPSQRCPGQMLNLLSGGAGPLYLGFSGTQRAE